VFDHDELAHFLYIFKIYLIVLSEIGEDPDPQPDPDLKVIISDPGP